MQAMVAAVSTTLNPKSAAQKGPHLHPTRQNSTRIPLLPSEPDNAIAPRKPKAREVTSRFLPSSNSSSAASATRRSPSPSVSRTSSLAATPKPTGPSVNQRSQSVERRRIGIGTPRPYSLDFRTGNDSGGVGEVPVAQKLLLTSTRSLSVSFQGESFSLQVSKTRPAPSPSMRKGTPERRKLTTPARGGGGTEKAENSKLILEQHRWPGRLRQANFMSRSLDYEDVAERKRTGVGSVNVVRQLQNYMVEGRPSFDGVLSSDSGNEGLEKAAEPVIDATSAIVSDNYNAVSSDSESVSSGSNSGAQDCGEGQGQRGPRGIVVPARFWQETNNRLRRQTENGSPLSRNVGVRSLAPSKVIAPKKFAIDSPTSSPREVANSRGQLSPIRGTFRPASPSRLLASSTVTRVRNTVASTPLSSLSNIPSIASFIADARRGRIGENRIIDAHLLRLLHNRLLQWRFVNARADATLSALKMNAERSLCNAWMSTSKVRESVRAKRSELQLLKQKLTLTSILSWQMLHLEEWDQLDQDFSNSLSGVTEALRASTLRLPVVGAAKADVQGIKDAISSAVDVLQTMASSICFLLSKVGEVNSLASELANVSGKECALLDRVQDILSAIAALQVKECSLRTHILQLKYVPST